VPTWKDCQIGCGLVDDSFPLLSNTRDIDVQGSSFSQSQASHGRFRNGENAQSQSEGGLTPFSAIKDATTPTEPRHRRICKGVTEYGTCHGPRNRDAARRVNQTRSHPASSKKKGRRDFEATDRTANLLGAKNSGNTANNVTRPRLPLLAFKMVGILTNLAVFAQLSKVAF
jgi:hypothetical protein